MAKFGIFKDVYRAMFKPGIREAFNPYGSNQGQQLPYVGNNGNVSGIADNLGSLWVRDASKPIYFNDPANPLNTELGYPWKQLWSTALGQNFLLIGQGNLNLGLPTALYHVIGVFGDPTVPWATDPYYLQIHAPYNLATAPAPGAIPQVSVPCPRPNEGIGRAEIVFGADTPFNAVSGQGGGACICISSTPDTYTAPAVNAGQISANWAYYNYKI